MRSLLSGALLLFLSNCGNSGGSSKDASLDGSRDTSADGSVDALYFDTAPGKDVMTLDQARDLTSPDQVEIKDGAQASGPDAGQEVGPGLDSAMPDAPSAPDSGPADTALRDTGSQTGREAGSEDAPQTDAPTLVDAQNEDGLSAPFCSSNDRNDAGVAQRLCFDFSDPATADRFLPEAGTWTVSNGVYKGNGPQGEVTCPVSGGSLMTSSVLRNFSAKDVRVHARMKAVRRPDKVLVLRSRTGGNRIEINFRADYGTAETPMGGDLYIDALINCEQVTYLKIDTVHIHHAVGQAIVADVQLIGQHLTVAVDGQIVFDQTIPVPTDPGSVGVAVFRDSEVEFDDFMVEALN